MEGIKLQQSAPQKDGQDIIRQGDQEDSSPLDQEPPLGQRDSKEIESGPHQLEPSEQEIQNFVQEMREKSNLPDISDGSSLSSNSQEDKRHLGVVEERMLRSWFQPVSGSV